MNMPKRPDEDMLWNAFGPGREHKWVREAHQALGIPAGRAYYLCCKWADQGRYEWGTSWRMGWKVQS